jgi:UDP-N-acetylglucosamine 2-epimerase (non-hydrolysing)
MAPVIQAARLHVDQVLPIVCCTGQHKEVLDGVYQLFDMAPKYDLDIMQQDQTLMYITSTVKTKVRPILLAESPDWVLVQGDTATAMSTSLAALREHIKIGHVEAGLRTYNKYQPFPEEFNRRFIDRIADLHFAPTEAAVRNLIREGARPESIVLTGNTVVDAMRQVTSLRFDPVSTPLARLPIGQKRVILVTAHRRESFGQGIKEICLAIRSVVRDFHDVHIAFPVHLNPNVWGPVHQMLQGVANTSLLPLLDYVSFIWLMKNSYLVVTDSGGVQEEAPRLGKPVLVTRKVTERPEGIQAGCVRLVGLDATAIAHEIRRLLVDTESYRSMARMAVLYGDGHAGDRIIETLLHDSYHVPQTVRTFKKKVLRDLI